MDQRDQQSWNQRYLAGEFGYREPDGFVTEAHKNYLQPLLLAGSAGLDLAGGAGHHAVWLAEQGWREKLADWSDAALAMARDRAEHTDCTHKLDTVQSSALDFVMQSHREGRRFGFILVTFFLDRPVLPWLSKILVRGGLLLYRTYTENNELLGNPRGPRNPEYLLRSQELLTTFRDMRILQYNETMVAKGVAELIAQRAESPAD